MHKKKLFLAIAGLASGLAAAQSNVTVYGLIDAGFNQVRSDGKKSVNSIDSSQSAGSRLGFKGTEDLGDGLKALFVLEYALSNDTNSALGSASKWSGTVTRQSYVGLSGNWGTVVAGRLQGAAFNWACSYSPLTGGIFGTDMRLGAQTSLTCATAGRAENAVGYISPSIGGFTVELNHVRRTESASTTNVPDDYANVVGVTYRNGPLQVGAVYNDVNRNQTGANTDIREYGLGASYDFQVAKLFATYANNRIDGQQTQSKYQLGASVPVSAKGTVHASYAANSMIGTGTDSHVWSTAYFHDLSKRTMLYAGYGRMGNQSGASLSMAAPPEAAVNGGNSSVIAMGVKHSF